MAIIQKQLGQLRPANTTAASIYSPAASTQATSMRMTIVNTTGSDADMRIFQDDNGTTYDESTALIWDQTLAGGQTVTLGIPPMDNSAGNVGVRTSVASALTFTLSGTEIT